VRSAAWRFYVLLLACAGLVWWVASLRYTPKYTELLRIEGEVVRMSIGRASRSPGGCLNLHLTVESAHGITEHRNSRLCRRLRGVPVLPPGSPVVVLVEPPSFFSGEILDVWELRSEGRTLISYETARSAMGSRRRGFPVAILLICVIGIGCTLVILPHWFIKPAAVPTERVDEPGVAQDAGPD
jgi:hypothetical protein